MLKKKRKEKKVNVIQSPIQMFASGEIVVN